MGKQIKFIVVIMTLLVGLFFLTNIINAEINMSDPLAYQRH